MKTLNLGEIKEGNIVLTGGHAATTAMAVLESINKSERLKKLNIFWIGSKIAKEGSLDLSLEAKILPKIGVEFIDINAGKLQTKFTKYTIPSLLKFPIGFVQAFFILLKLKPLLTLSFGGYASFPVVFWAWIFRIPTILHEQTVAAGRASLASIPFVSKITLARKESLQFFPVKKSVVIGNPIRQAILKVKTKTKIGDPPTLLIMGGSRGSEFINELVGSFSKKFVKKYKIFHLAGGRKNVEPHEMAKIYRQADIILSRSGANTVSEILIVKRPTILIPLPRTFMNEQGKNAKYAKDFGIAKVITEIKATPQRIEMEIEEMRTNWQKIVNVVKRKISPDLGATEKLVDLLESYL